MLFEFSNFDFWLVVLCPVGGVIGSIAFAIMDSIDPLSSPKDENNANFASKKLQEKRGVWLGLRCALGAIVGLLVALYFIGSIQPNISTFSKLIALSIVAGYAAPKVWVANEIMLEAKLKTAIGKDKS